MLTSKWEKKNWKVEYEKMVERDFEPKKDMDSDDKELRDKIKKAEEDHSDKKHYQFDLQMALVIYEAIDQKSLGWKVISGSDFWKYLSIQIIPDIIYKRWNNGGSDQSLRERFYKKDLRTYPSSLWWYIYLSWQKDIKTTYEVLKNANTDHILNLVERNGREGLEVEVMRKLMHKISKENKWSNFRKIIIRHKAMNNNVIPKYYEKGEQGYVDMLVSTTN